MRDLYVLRTSLSSASKHQYLVGFPPNTGAVENPEEATAYASLELAEKMVPWMHEPCFAVRRPQTRADQFREILDDWIRSSCHDGSSLISEFDRIFPLTVVGELPKPFDAHMFQVIVGNIGTVYEGANFTAARTTFNHYVQYSRSSGSRATGQPVTLTRAGEPYQEFQPEPEEDEKK